MSRPPCPTGLRTLVVDDDQFMADVVTAVLRGLGLKNVQTVTDGEAALGRIDAEQIDLLVCDLNMPGMDGIRLLSRVAASPRPPAIILLSGEDPRILEASQRFAEAKALPLIGTLRKPVAVDALAAVLANYQPAPQVEAVAESHDHLDGEWIRQGLTGHALSMAYQPKVDLHTGSIDGIEALLRWQDSRFGVMPSLEVVKVAEDSDTIDELTLAVLLQVVRDRAVLVGNGFDLNVAVNVSMHNLRNLALIDKLSSIISDARDKPERYTLEVTETNLLADVAHVLEALIRLRLQGFRIAIDDYGTGAATMQFLMQLPSNELKIDRSFVTAAPRNEHGRVLLQSAVDLGIELGQTVIAEGIETESEALLVTKMGCHSGQGYFYGRPMALDALLSWMREHDVAPQRVKT